MDGDLKEDGSQPTGIFAGHVSAHAEEGGYLMSPDTVSFIDRTEGVSQEEWQALPVTFGATTMARLARTDDRYMQKHAEAFGGRKVAGRWLFSKSEAAKLLGIGE